MKFISVGSVCRFYYTSIPFDTGFVVFCVFKLNTGIASEQAPLFSVLHAHMGHLASLSHIEKEEESWRYHIA